MAVCWYCQCHLVWWGKDDIGDIYRCPSCGKRYRIRYCELEEVTD